MFSFILPFCYTYRCMFDDLHQSLYHVKAKRIRLHQNQLFSRYKPNKTVRTQRSLVICSRGVFKSCFFDFQPSFVKSKSWERKLNHSQLLRACKSLNFQCIVFVCARARLGVLSNETGIISSLKRKAFSTGTTLFKCLIFRLNVQAIDRVGRMSVTYMVGVVQSRSMFS